MPTPRFLEGRHVIVTGAGRGIGRAIALRLAAEGAAVSLMGRRLAPLEETVDRIEGSASAFTCDIRQQSQVDAAFEAAAAAHGPIYALVANAGIGGANEPGEADRFEDIVSTNLTGTYWCLRAAQRHLLGGPDPRHLVVIASILGRLRGARVYRLLRVEDRALRAGPGDGDGGRRRQRAVQRGGAGLG